MSKQTAVATKGKISWILESAGLAGGVRVVFEMAEGLRRKGWASDYYSLDNPPKWWKIPASQWHKFPNYGAMLKALRDNPAKIVATWWQTAMVLNEITSGRERLYYLVQDKESQYYSSPVLKKYVETTYGFGFNMFTTSHWVESQVSGTHYTGIGIRPHKFNPSDTRKRRAVGIARRQFIKGYPYLMELSQRMSHELAMPLHTYGVDRGINFGGLNEHLIAPDNNQVSELLQGSQYFVSTSQHEGFGLPLLEAMSAGAIVVTTDSDGIWDFCLQGHNAFIVEKNDPRKMIMALDRLDTDSELRAKLRANAYETARQWLWDRPIHQLDQYLSAS